MSENKKELACPIKLDWLKKWSQQIPREFWGKVEPYIETCLGASKPEKEKEVEKK
jgi:hypothetical protein